MLREYVKWDYELRTPVAARGGRRPRVRADAGRAARAGLPHAAARGAGRAGCRRSTITSPARRHVAASERLPDPARIDEAARLLARAASPAHPRLRGRARPARGARAGRARGGGRHRRRRGGSDARELPAEPPLHLGFNAALGHANPSLGEADVDPRGRRRRAVVSRRSPSPSAGARDHPPGRRSRRSRAIPMRSYPVRRADRRRIRRRRCRSSRRPCGASPTPRRWPRGGRASRRCTGERRARWAADADAQAGWPRPGFAWVTRCLQDLLDDRHGGRERVPDRPPLSRRSTGRGASSARRTRAGSAGACGAALGCKLAAPERDRDRHARRRLLFLQRAGGLPHGRAPARAARPDRRSSTTSSGRR